MRKKITLAEFEQLQTFIDHLEETWFRYLDEAPNEWYEFKYGAIIQRFMKYQRYSILKDQVKSSKWRKQAKMPAQTYRELVEMAEISKKLKEVLNHPPLGLNDVPLVISKGGRDAKRTATRANANN